MSGKVEHLGLQGGPAHGKEVTVGDYDWVMVPEIRPPTARARKNSRMIVDQFGVREYVNPALNWTVVMHRYDARTGQYMGRDDDVTRWRADERQGCPTCNDAGHLGPATGSPQADYGKACGDCR